jgi:hypothetical protein
LELAVLAEFAMQCREEHIDAAVLQYIEIVRSNISRYNAKAGFGQGVGNASAALKADVSFGAYAAGKHSNF